MTSNEQPEITPSAEWFNIKGRRRAPLTAISRDTGISKYGLHSWEKPEASAKQTGTRLGREDFRALAVYINTHSERGVSFTADEIRDEYIHRGGKCRKDATRC